MPLPQHLKTGFRGEQLAARYLRSHGFDVIEANFHSYSGETDIIALDKHNILCFVEVKTRSPGQLFSPMEAVDYEKQERLRRNAAAFQKMTEYRYKSTEFCIMEVILYDLLTADITLHRNAF